jgi:hypothetical protein
MNNLLLLAALGAGYVYFKKPKAVTKKSTKPKVETPKAETPKVETPPKNGKVTSGSKDVGYEIYDCNKLIIYDNQKAYDYAFDLGANTKELNGQFDDIFFGKCFEDPKDLTNLMKITENVDKAKFIFNLMKYALSGYATNHPDEKDDLLSTLNSIKNKLDDLLNIDVSDFDVSLVKQNVKLPLDKGFIIVNCDKFTVTDSVKMKSYMDEAMISLFNSSNYKEKDGEAPYAPFDFAVQFLKQISPECYDRLVSEKISKDNFVISYMFIVASFLAYISFRFLMKDGVFIPDNWKETFGSLEEWTAYMTAANEVLANWVNPLYVQFGLDNQKMTDLITQIGQVGKYPLN